MTLEIEHWLPSASEFMNLRRQTNWGVPGKCATETVLEHSYSGVVAMANGKAIGMARTVGDGCLILYIQDVVIAAHYRPKGIGRLLMRALIDKAAQSALPSCTIGLFAAKGQAGFYETLGFGIRNLPAYGPGMHTTLSALAKSNSAA